MNAIITLLAGVGVPIGVMAPVSAQFQLPGSGAASGANRADPQLQRIDSAIASNDFSTAVQAYRAAVQSPLAQTTTGQAELTKRFDRLVARGINGDLLNQVPPTPSKGPAKSQGQASSQGQAGSQGQANTAPDTNPASWPLAHRQQETRRLLATGRAALDRGDVRGAFQMATQAQSLGVAQNEFNPGETRPWQLLLDVQAAARRSGVDLSQVANTATYSDPTTIAGSPAFSPSPNWQTGTIAQTGGVAPIGSGSSGNVTQAGGSMPVGGGNQFYLQPVQAIAPIDDAPANQGPETIGRENASLDTGNASPDKSEGEKLFAEGMVLLSSGLQGEARQKFVEAWDFESELPTETRRALQDKLTLLQPTRMPLASKTNAPLTAIEKADLEAAQQVKRLYREVTTELANANERKESTPLAAVDDLQRLARRVDGANIDEASRASLGAMVNRALSQQQAYVDANRAKIDLDLANDAVRMEMETEAARDSRIDSEISLLVETFNDLMDQKRFAEAQVIAKQVAELKPDDPIATSMRHLSRTGVRLQMDEEINAGSEEGFVRQMLAVGAAAIAPDPDRPFSFQDPKSWEDLSRRRLANDSRDSKLSIREQDIIRKLQSDVELKYRDRPLGEVLDDLSAVTGVPIAIDSRALSAVRVTRDTPVSKSISSRLSLQSALNLLLEDLDLTFVVRNDVLNITSREARRTMTQTKTYRVADLVTPIPNFISGYEHGLAGALASAYQMINPVANVQVVPVSMTDLGGRMSDNNSGNLGRNMLGQYGSGGGGLAGAFGSAGATQGGRGGGSLADFDSLMTLIQQTIEPDTWEALGGVGTMAPYPQNLSLVISTTSDVHDQIVDLLESLRRLQNLQITIEVRFITLADTFFEQIGIDFDIRFDDNAPGIPADDSGTSVTIGLDAPGIPTPDLDIRFDQSTIGGALPPFGGDPGAISTIGFAILSDIEAFFFLQAAQGNNRSNIMQAPKVTLFDGQIASINDTVSRPFVTSIIPVVGDFAVAQQPVIVVLDEGTRLNVQGVVSDDKRFVRLTLVPTFSQIGEVNTFTYEGSRTSRNSSTANADVNGDGVIDEKDENEQQEVVQGTTVQQPTFASTSVSTTVSVPDGGTILLGGIKRMSEGRNERGVPFLSKIPYVSRLFRNTGAGRTSTSLMLMVTPRIIIQEEEEVAQTGFDPGR